MPVPGKRFGGRGRKVPVDVRVEIVRRRRAGESCVVVATDLGVTPRTVQRLMNDAGGMAPRWKDRSPSVLSLSAREEISRGVRAGCSNAEIARTIGVHPSTVGREIKRNCRPGQNRDAYRAVVADERAHRRARRPKLAKLERCPRLADWVEAKLERCWSPQQISATLVVEFPDDEEMRVSPETIYKTLYLQGRGGLRKELAASLRTGRAKRHPHGRTVSNGKLTNMVMISQRPPEAADRAVPGHWEGDLIIGANGQTAIATLVERSTRYLMLAALPDGRTADKVCDALTTLVQRLPAELTKSLTWDQGKELAHHTRFTIDTGIQVYFCDPHSPWQRGSNENTNGLLRQYFPKGTPLTADQHHLDAVARELNERPRQTLGWMTPSHAFNQLVAPTA